MLLRIFLTTIWLLLLALPPVQNAMASGISERFSYLLLFNLAW
ncbi:MAG: hypothetical protein E7H57_11710 [Pantoea sp.]|nr:hypothetical protein [Pantoea sp.]